MASSSTSTSSSPVFNSCDCDDGSVEGDTDFGKASSGSSAVAVASFGCKKNQDKIGRL